MGDYQGESKRRIKLKTVNIKNLKRGVVSKHGCLSSQTIVFQSRLLWFDIRSELKKKMEVERHRTQINRLVSKLYHENEGLALTPRCVYATKLKAVLTKY